jgi:hypothetical protein
MDRIEFNDLVKISSITLPNAESVILTNMSHDPEVMESEALIPRGNTIKLGKLVRRLTDDNNLPIGKAIANPILDTQEYVVEFDDGEQLEFCGKHLCSDRC